MTHSTPETQLRRGTPVERAARFSVAPMMAWTDRHCRTFHRAMTQRALLYTEMVTAAALVHGDADHLLQHGEWEHPVAVQLGGSDPDLLAQATAICAAAGYPEINLNVGCPSDRVQSGAFGAVLMKSPELVARCVDAMQGATNADITVKCRIGVDDQTPSDVLPAFLEEMRSAGVRRITVHARMAWLKGLSPKENRTIPPLNYDLVHEMKRTFPDLHLSINGGIETQDQVADHLQVMDGVMVGRAAYHTPYAVLAHADTKVFGETRSIPSPLEVGHAMTDYIANHLQDGGRLHQMTRHMLGLFSGLPGARLWRRSLSELGANDQATVRDYERVLGRVAAAMTQAQEQSEDLERSA